MGATGHARGATDCHRDRHVAPTGYHHARTAATHHHADPAPVQLPPVLPDGLYSTATPGFGLWRDSLPQLSGVATGCAPL